MWLILFCGRCPFLSHRNMSYKIWVGTIYHMTWPSATACSGWALYSALYLSPVTWWHVTVNLYNMKSHIIAVILILLYFNTTIYVGKCVSDNHQYRQPKKKQQWVTVRVFVNRWFKCAHLKRALISTRVKLKACQSIGSWVLVNKWFERVWMKITHSTHIQEYSENNLILYLGILKVLLRN